MIMIKTIIFDVNETLIDLRTVEKDIDQFFKSTDIFQEFFIKALHLGSVLTNTRIITPNFKEILLSTVHFFLEKKEITRTHKEVEAFLKKFINSQAYSDVIPALEKLKSNNFRVVALSNSPSQMVKAQLTNSGIYSYFDEILSVEDIKTLKPSLAVYEYAAYKLQMDINRLYFLASHDWDIEGAKSSKMITLYIDRDLGYNSLYKAPDYKSKDLVELVSKII